jgi:hypothetical protein
MQAEETRREVKLGDIRRVMQGVTEIEIGAQQRTDRETTKAIDRVKSRPTKV